MENRGERIRKEIQQSFDRCGLNAVVTGTGSLFQIHFPFQKGMRLDSPQIIHHSTDIEKREVEFRIRMLIRGVHVMHGGGSLSMAHSDEDIDQIIQATGKVAEEMMLEENG